MPAAHGRLTRVYVNGYDLTGFFRKSSMEQSREMAESTVFNLTDKTYLPGLQDASLSLDGLFDAAIDGIEDVVNTAFSTDPTIVTLCPQGDVLGNVAYGLSGLETKLTLDASKDDIVSLSNELQSTVGRDRLLVQQPLATQVASGFSTSIDNTAVSTPNGGVGYLHVPNITGITNLSVVIRDSADNISFNTILTFPNVTASRAKHRVEITGTVRRYLIALWTFTGSGSAQFWTGFGRR